MRLDGAGGHPDNLLASLSLAASPTQVPILRSLVSKTGQRVGLSIDATADLVLAVDEVANQLLVSAAPSSKLVCHIHRFKQTLRLAVTSRTTNSIDASTTSLSWFILQTLSDDVTLEQVSPTTDGDCWIVTFVLSKQVPRA